MANDTTAKVGLTLHGTGGELYENIDTSKTLAVADCGVVQNIVADSQTITLPATVVGYTFTVRNAGAAVTSGPAGTGANGTVAVIVAPNASDLIAGGSWTAADNKALTNT